MNPRCPGLAPDGAAGRAGGGGGEHRGRPRRCRPATQLAVAIAVAAAPAGCGPADAPMPEQPPATVVSVQVATLGRRTLRSWVEASGTVAPQPATPSLPPARASVAAPVVGLLAEVRCAEGQRVEKGALLFALDARVADLTVARAERALAFAERELDRQHRLGAGEATSQRRFDDAERAAELARTELEQARAERSLLDVEAPLAGTVVAVRVEPGDAVDPSTVLAEIVDLDRLVVSAAVRTTEIRRVAVGQQVELLEAGAGATDGGPGSVVASSKVSFVGAAVEPATDTVEIRAEVPPGSDLRPGQFVALRLLVEERSGRLAMPVDGLVRDGAASYVFLVHGDVATRTPVRTGIRDSGFVEIEAEGIEEGAIVVTTGAYGLPPESKVRVVEP